MPFVPLDPDEEVFAAPSSSFVPLADDDEIFPFPSVAERMMEGATRFFGGANIAIGETLGAPMDFSAFLARSLGISQSPTVGGSQDVFRAFTALGFIKPEDEEDSFLGSMGRMTGMAATMGFPVGGAVSRAARVVTGAQAPATTAGGRIIEEIGQTALTSPRRFVAGEVAAATAAGAAGFSARQRFPDSDAAVIIAELVGGVTPAAALGTAKMGVTVLGGRLAHRLGSVFTQKVGQRRAAERLQGLARDPETAAARLLTETERGETTRAIPESGAQQPQPVDILPEANLTPAQITGDEGLMSLERSIIETSEQLKSRADEQVSEATRIIRESVEGLGEGVSIERTVETLQAARAHLSDLIDIRVRVAGLRADELIADLKPTATRADANIIARNELDAALVAARKQERELFANVPLDIKVPVTLSRQTFNEIVKSTPKAQREDIPAIAINLLGRDTEIPEGFEEAFKAAGLVKETPRFGDAESVSELQGLRSKLLEEARGARAAGQFNKARISDNLAEAVLQDLGAVRGQVQGEAGDALRQALDFSADLNQKFTRGPVARILGTERRGGPRVAGELALETIVGRGGPRARVDLQALTTAAPNPVLRGATEDFLLDDFNRMAVRDGNIERRGADAFNRKYQDVLQDFPDIQRRINEAVTANDASISAQSRADGLARRLNDPKISRSSVFLNEPVEDAIKRVSKTTRPGRTMEELVRQAGRDETGDALKGLKSAFGDFLLTQVEVRQTTQAGQFMISGTRFKNFLNEGKTSRMAKALFSEQELARLNVYAETALRVERSVAARPRPEGVINDAPTLIFSVMAGVAGAALGRRLATFTGGGTVQTPGIMANLFRRALDSGVNDPARRILFDALDDNDLYLALLSPSHTQTDATRRQLNAWLVGVAKDAIVSEDEDQSAEGFLLRAMKRFGVR